jgi:hypothetical protein
LVCGISATGNIHFNNVVQGTTVQSSDTTTVTNTGDVPVTPSISGGNWIGNNYGTIGDWMPVGQTWWTISTWPAAHQLSGTPASIGTLTNTGDNMPVWYELVVPAQQQTDSYSQTLTFTVGC